MGKVIRFTGRRKKDYGPSPDTGYGTFGCPFDPILIALERGKTGSPMEPSNTTLTNIKRLEWFRSGEKISYLDDYRKRKLRDRFSRE